MVMHHVVMRSRFPAVVDEVTARLTAGVVLLAVLLMLALQQWWVFLPLAADFTLRATLGPRVSPLARVVSRWVRPRVPALPHPTAGTPKRFAAAVGAVLTGLASVLWLLHLATGAAWLGTAVLVVAVVMAVFPALEALAGLCVGCVVFGWLMRAGVVPEDVCLECADITSRLRAPGATT
ncbi:hypothetical protein GCM10011509_20420 [Ornithinimicrobium pekingense]|uniref:DUF4395 domain-containing protein n=2 Tax=Ornithinimicrobium pekingense TaxID=384677 RepID=A0ABQ2F8R1_9MICO|nr:hypothetical protein GCM10011509_20420 [Ornithinimicrobium pekingense]